MKERNEYIETGGLYFESSTHEWFNDKGSTEYAHRNSAVGNDALPNLMCFVVRNKETGEYDRVIMDMKEQAVIYNSKSLEDIGFKIDQYKIQKRYADVEQENPKPETFADIIENQPDKDKSVDPFDWRKFERE